MAPTLAILVFKTNINHPTDLANLTALFELEPDVLKWSVDRQDIDKVLRIETSQLSPAYIEALLTRVGYLCQELPD
jgi:hypothetical protein